MCKPNWMFWLSLGSLLLAGGLALAKYFGAGPGQLVSGGHIRIPYIAVLAYTYGALPVTAVVLLICILLSSVWVWQLLQRVAGKTAFVGVSLAMFALLWSGWSTMPRFFVGYQHLTSLSLGADVYHLGMRTAFDGDYFFVVSKCPRGQLNCDAYGIAPIEQAERADPAAIRLEAEGATGILRIQTPARAIPVTFPIP